MKPSIQTLGQILYSPSQYVIPVFQRHYRWETSQWAKLWDGIVEFQKPEKKGNHFMGFLVFVPGLAQPGQHTTFHLIDGQQRLSTSSILMAAIRNLARKQGQSDLAEEIHDDYLVHPRKKGDQHFRLLPKERDHASYVAIVSGEGQPTGRMADALTYFEERLTELGPNALRPVFNTAAQRFEFMCATLEAENAYNIFKSLNSTGVPLGSSDLIRNFVFMHVPPDDQDAFDQQLWDPLERRFTQDDGTLDEGRFSKFFRDFLMADGAYVAPTDTFQAFESRYEATGFSSQELARTLLRNVEYYACISGATPDVDPDVTRALRGLNALESSTTYPLLLALFQRRATDVIGSDALAKAIEMLRGFILRRFVCGESSRGYGRLFIRALAKDDGRPMETLEAYLLERGWPDDQRFEAAFVDFPLYQRGYTWEILEALERARGHKEPADLAATQVEHVMPQTLSEAWFTYLGPDAERIHATWLHRPGNLTLSAYNQELWNHPFAVKKARYATSNIVLTRELTDHAEWTEDSIRLRGERLAREAAVLWVGPKEPRQAVTADTDDEGPGRRELRMRFWQGLSDFLSTEYPALPEVEPRKEWANRLTSGVRHVTFVMAFNLRQQYVGVDVGFWRPPAIGAWETLRDESAQPGALVGSDWHFEVVGDGSRTRMALNLPCPEIRDEASWPAAYQWLGEKLSFLYEQLAPRLREEIARREGI